MGKKQLTKKKLFIMRSSSSLKVKNNSKIIDVTEFRLKLYPKNFSKMRDFYENKLGFDVLSEWNRGSKGVMFKVNKTVFELIEDSSKCGVFKGSGISLEVKNVRELWKYFKTYDKINHKLRRNSWGDFSFSILDPEGFEITFFTKFKLLK